MRCSLSGPPRSAGEFLSAVFENWESEFLQMATYVILTAYLFQKGSAESKDPAEKAAVDEDPRDHAADRRAPWPVRRGGWVLKVYEHSLGLALSLLFLLSFGLHLLNSARRAAEDARLHENHGGVSPWSHVSEAQFWFESLQNWQSEFMSTAVLVLLSIYLRQKGSPESKPVAAPHDKTGAS